MNQYDDKTTEALRLIRVSRFEEDDQVRALARAELRERAAEFILHVLGLPDERPGPELCCAP